MVMGETSSKTAARQRQAETTHVAALGLALPDMSQSDNQLHSTATYSNVLSSAPQLVDAMLCSSQAHVCPVARAALDEVEF
jgi:hypothetical protein